MIWRIPSSEQVKKLMSSTLINIGATHGVDDGSNRADTALPLVIDRIRGAILAGGRTPLAVEDGSIPPEAVHFALLLALRIIFASVPSLMNSVQDRRPDFLTQCDAAEKWIDRVLMGEIAPTHPTVNATATTTGTYWKASTFVDLGTD